MLGFPIFDVTSVTSETHVFCREPDDRVQELPAAPPEYRERVDIAHDADASGGNHSGIFILTDTSSGMQEVKPLQCGSAFTWLHSKCFACMFGGDAPRGGLSEP